MKRTAEMFTNTIDCINNNLPTITCETCGKGYVRRLGKRAIWTDEDNNLYIMQYNMFYEVSPHDIYWW